MVRVSERMRFDISNNRMHTARHIADQAGEAMLSGRKLRKLSDAPVDAVRAFKNRDKLANIGQYRRTLDFTRGFMSKSEEALRNLTEVLIRARELAVQQANATWDENTRKTVAEEVKQLSDHAITIGNTTFSDRYVFGGFQTSTPPLSHDGHYLGDDGSIFVQLDEDVFRPINISGRAIFELDTSEEASSEPLVHVLQKMFDALNENSVSGIQNSIPKLDGVLQKIANATAIIGARSATLDEYAQRQDLSEEFLTNEGNKLEAVDPVEGAMDMKRAEVTLQSTLNATNRILQPSLLQFMK